GVAAPGTYHFTYTVSGTGCPDATAIVTVNVHEAPDAGTDNIVPACNTEANFDLFTSLGGTPDGGGNWSDDDGSGATITGNSVDLSGLTAGDYNFTYTINGTGCPDATATVTVNVHEAPDAGANNTIEVCAS